MTNRNLRSLLAALLAPAPLFAQTTGPAGSETVTLSPFEVVSTRDVGYTATSSLAGGRLATDLKDTPAAISVLTREFLDDIAASTFIEASQWATNVVSVYSYSQPAPFNDYNTATRSLGASFQSRNYFIWYVNSDAFNTERLDFARGPNSVVFGDANVGGTANISTKRANAGELTEIQYRWADYGGKGRVTADVNRAIRKNWFVRVNALYDRNDLWEDRTRIDRDGFFFTTTFQPFKQTSLRAEAEIGRVERVLSNVAVDSVSTWDGVTTVATPLTAGNFGGGLSRRTTDYLVFTPASAGLGVVNWRNHGFTTGTNLALDLRAPAGTPASFPLLPYYGWSFVAPNQKALNKYHTYGIFAEQRVGERLFLEAAYNYQQQYRYVDQMFFEGVQVDVNAFLPDGRPNPYFRQRFTETGNTIQQTQGNKVHDARVSAAYLVATPLTDQRLLASFGRREDFFELDTYRIGRTNNPTVTDMFNAANAVRTRRYESELKAPWFAPIGNFNGIETRYGNQNTLGQSQTVKYLQAAASGGWFKERRLKTLLGVRRDDLERLGNNGVVRGPSNDIIARGPDVVTVARKVTTMTGGAVYQLTDWLGVFANYGESFQPSGTAVDINGTSLSPIENKGTDFGMRLSLLGGRISGSISRYRNEQLNQRIAGGATEINAIWADLNRSETVAAGYNDTYEFNGRGWEFDFTANPTPNWRLMVNFALPETEQVDGYQTTIAYSNANIATWRAAAAAQTDVAIRNRINQNITTLENRIGGFAPGRTLDNTFDYTANFFTNYAFREGTLKGFSVGGGVNLRGRRVVSNRPGNAYDYLYANGYQLVTLTAGYRTRIFGRTTNFQLNVSNLLDEEFKRYTNFLTVTSGGTSTFFRNRFRNQDPRKLALTTTVRF